MIINKYDVNIHKIKRYIPIKDKFGDEIIIPMVQWHITLERNRTVVLFKRHKHCGQWKWSDSRLSGTQTDRYILDELARMLFGNRINLAREFLRYYGLP